MLTNQLNLVLSQKNPPRDLVETTLFASSSEELNRLIGKRVLFRNDFSRESIPLQTLRSKSSPESSFPFSDIPACDEKKLIVAIDSSSALIGETEDGTILAGRVTIVFIFDQKIQTYWRAGPSIFYFDPMTVLSKVSPNLPSRIADELLLSRDMAERYVRVRLERTAQLIASQFVSDAIVLIDGSLRSSQFESKQISLREIERHAQQNADQLVGFSKASKVRAICDIANILMGSDKYSVFFDITPMIVSGRAKQGNRTLLVKFMRNFPVLRADFSPINFEEDPQLLAKIKHNDLIFRGYPESLRLAHHLSVFDSAEISSIRSYLSKQYKLVHVPADDLRTTMLGKLV